MIKTTEEEFTRRREELVRTEIEGRGTNDPRILAAMRKVPRHEFVSEEYRSHAYDNRPLPIGERQTISQPLMVAMMTDALDVQPDNTTLEIGAGSGYQAAILAELCRRVYTLERYEALAERARRTLADLGYNNVEVMVADGSQGYQERAPYDRIVVSAGSPNVPDVLLRQLTPDGKLVIPIGDFSYQALTLVEVTPDGPRRTEIAGCVFVPLIGKYGWTQEEVERG